MLFSIFFAFLVGSIASIATSRYSFIKNHGRLLSDIQLTDQAKNETVGWSLGGDEEEKLFYMYDLPEEFWWSWPQDSANCSNSDYVGQEHKAFSGMGELVVPDDGLFLTWHFSLFSSLYNRYKRSRLRTYDPEKASVFIIPYDLSLDGFVNPKTCNWRRRCSQGRAKKLESILSGSKWFQRYQGKDHVVLWSLGQYNPYPLEYCDSFMMKFCKNCMFTCYWMDPLLVDNRFVSVPFPSAYHWHDSIVNLPWDTKNAPARNISVVYLGSTQTLTPPHTHIRRAMAQQCVKHKYCEWLKIAHSSKDGSISDYLQIYKKSVFCLSPPGDDPGRKAVFDAIISGCIPVIFHPSTLYNQYYWHLSEEDALDISVSVPGVLVKSNKFQFMDFLLSIDMDVIKAKQEAIARIAPGLQYSVPPIENLKDKYDSTPWDPPFVDGADLALLGMFDRASHLLKNESVGIPRVVMSLEKWGERYADPIAHVPGTPVNRYRHSNISNVDSEDKKKRVKMHAHTHSIKRMYNPNTGSNHKKKHKGANLHHGKASNHGMDTP